MRHGWFFGFKLFSPHEKVFHWHMFYRPFFFNPWNYQKRKLTQFSGYRHHVSVPKQHLFKTPINKDNGLDFCWKSETPTSLEVLFHLSILHLCPGICSSTHDFLTWRMKKSSSEVIAEPSGWFRHAWKHWSECRDSLASGSFLLFQRPGKATFEPRVKGEAFLRLSVEPIGSMVAWWYIYRGFEGWFWW